VQAGGTPNDPDEKAMTRIASCAVRESRLNEPCRNFWNCLTQLRAAALAGVQFTEVAELIGRSEFSRHLDQSGSLFFIRVIGCSTGQRGRDLDSADSLIA
jgi:hypothetical protein